MNTLLYNLLTLYIALCTVLGDTVWQSWPLSVILLHLDRYIMIHHYHYFLYIYHCIFIWRVNKVLKLPFFVVYFVEGLVHWCLTRHITWNPHGFYICVQHTMCNHKQLSWQCFISTLCVGYRDNIKYSMVYSLCNPCTNPLMFVLQRGLWAI